MSDLCEFVDKSLNIFLFFCEINTPAITITIPVILNTEKISEIKIAENIAVKTGIRFEKTLVRLTPSSFTVMVKKIKAREEAKKDN